MKRKIKKNAVENYKITLTIIKEMEISFWENWKSLSEPFPSVEHYMKATG
jgi:hypothetical protein